MSVVNFLIVRLMRSAIASTRCRGDIELLIEKEYDE